MISSWVSIDHIWLTIHSSKISTRACGITSYITTAHYTLHDYTHMLSYTYNARVFEEWLWWPGQCRIYCNLHNYYYSSEVVPSSLI